MMLKRITMFSMALLVAPVALAGFSTHSSQWPNNKTVVDEEITDTDLIMVNKTIDDNRKKATPPAPKQTPRYPEQMKLYVGFGLSPATVEIRHIRNQSYGVLQNLVVAQDSLKKCGTDWEIVAGTKYHQLRFELDYIYHKTLNYNANPVLSGNAASLTSQVWNRSVLLNVYVDFDKLGYFRPYFGVLTGLVWNQTWSVLTGGGVGNGAGKYQSHIGWAWGASAGARVPFLTRWFAYFGYRYTGQSKVYWKDNTSLMQLNGQYVYSGFVLGVQFLV